MFFNADDDEQDFLSSSGGSKLASLFGVDKASNQGGNESLKYTAPKQPRKKEAPNQSGGAPAAVTFATAVHAYKYVDGQYASQGKLGAAILGSPASQDYRILLYVSKQQQVTNVRITPAFVFTIQANNYASFYDDARQSWSLMFDNEQNSEKFAKQVGLARAISTGTALDSVVTQDLHLGDGGSLETGDLVEVKYTGWLLTNGTFGQEFDSNVKTDKQFKFKIGKGKVIKGWDIGVVGMKKGSKRLLVVPPSLGYGSQGAGNKIPPNSTLIFEVLVVRVKLSKAESPKPSPAPTPEPTPLQNSTPSPAPSDPELDDSTVKGRTKSITEQMTHQGGAKANLISRMAKMGKPMLPLQGAVAADPESDEEPVPESPKPVAVTAAPVTAPTHAATKPPVVAKPVAQQPMAAPVDYTQTAAPVTSNPLMPQPSFAPPPGHQMALYQSPQALLQQQQAAFLQQQQLQQQAAFQPPASSAFPTGTYPAAPAFPTGPAAAVNPADSATPVLLSETRQQNTELRLAVGKVTDKVDTILQKMDHLQTQQSGAMALQSSAPNMEASVLMHNVQRIVQENERLRKEGYEKSSRIEAQNNKISELLQSNQMFVEKSQTLLEQRNEGFKVTATTSQAKVLALEQEKVQLATELSTATSQLGTLQLEIAGMRKREMELQQKLGSSSNDFKKNTEELENLQLQHTEDEERIKNLTSGLREEKQRRKEGDNKLSQLNEELSDLRVTAESLQKNLSERKKKAAEERRKMEEDMEDSKLQFEQEIEGLREKLRRQKNSTDAAKAEQVSKLEEEIMEEWKAKSEKQLAAAQDRHGRALQGVKEEKEELEQKVKELESKIQTLRKSSGGSDERIRSLEDEVEDLTDWKNKYDSLRDQASAMRDKYETRISEVEEERDSLATQRDQLYEKVATLQKNGASTTLPGGTGSESVVTEVKKIMNSVYQQLHAKFTAEENYTGADVLAAILEAIKTTTLKLVQQSSQGPATEEEEEEDDKEEEEEDEDELEDSEEEDVKDSPPPNTQTVPQVEKETTKAVPSAEKQEPLEDSEESDDFDEEEEETLPESPEIPKITDDDKSQPAEDPIVEPQPPQTQESSPSVDNSDLETGDNKSGVDNSQEQQNNEPVIEQNMVENLPETNHVTVESPISEPVKRDSESSEIIPVSSRTPPPLLDDEEDEDEDKEEDAGDKPLFGEDDTVEDTLGISFKQNNDKEKKDKKPPTKSDIENDEDLKPQPPPPLFGDDDDDDDLDWLS